MLFPQPGKMLIFYRVTNMQDFQTKKLLKLAQALSNKAVSTDTYMVDTNIDSSVKIQRMSEYDWIKGA